MIYSVISNLLSISSPILHKDKNSFLQNFPTDTKSSDTPNSVESVGTAGRVTFVCQKNAKLPIPKFEEWKPLADALVISEKNGAAPVLEDGRVAGNGAFLCQDGTLIVSKSGRIAGTKYTAEEFVRVSGFDEKTWTATFNSSGLNVKPSSDTPLLYFSLKEAPIKFQWTKHPKFVLHGHSCSSAEEASRFGIPCSDQATLCGTPEDLEQLSDLLKKYPYPENKLFVRRNHGFFLLADSSSEAIQIFEKRLTGVRPRDKSDECS